MDGSYGSGRFCSKRCASGFSTSLDREEINRRVSASLIGNVPSNKGVQRVAREERLCLECGIAFVVRLTSTKRHCSLKCGVKKCGGYRPGAGRSKGGWYRGVWCDSTWELAWVVYHLDHGIPFQRNTRGFPYSFNGVDHLYYPDFIVGDRYVEVKGWKTSQSAAKHDAFPHELEVVDKQGIAMYMQYVTERYGRNLVKLYEDRPHETMECEVCGMKCRKVYCSRRCAGIGVRKKCGHAGPHKHRDGTVVGAGSVKA